MEPLGSYDDVSKILGMSRSTLYGMTSMGRLHRGVYVGHGKFNMEKLRKHIDDCTLFVTAQPRRIARAVAYNYMETTK